MLALVALCVPFPVHAVSAESGMQGMAMTALERAKSGLAERIQDMRMAPSEVGRISEALAAAVLGGEGVRALTYLLILILVGCGAEWLYWTYASAPLRVIKATRAVSRRHAARLALRRMVLLGVGLLLFAVATIATSAAFIWPAGVHAAVVAATFAVVVVRLAWMAVEVIIVPGPAHRAPLRLLPLAQGQVHWLSASVLGVALGLAIGGFVPALIEPIAGARHLAGALRVLAASLTAALLVLALLLLARGSSRSTTGDSGRRRRLPQFPRAIVVALLVVAVYGLWLLGAEMAAAIAAIVSMVVALQLVLRVLVFYFWEAEIAADAVAAKDRTGTEVIDPSLAPSIVLSVARFIIVLLGLGACALVLNAPMSDMAKSPHALVRLGFELLGVAALGLFAHVVWIVIRTTIDHRLERIGPINVGDPHGEPSPNARLLTLLPLLRTTAAVLILVMMVLSSLWALGIEITPLLAGAGVLGLALGFGAQALVRDIIAGIFYLAEDVFRVGEYIESGTTTKGTVERITLRTVALRHHNGPLHFVPYGALGTVRNNSRDWVIDKFNLPLPIDADSEKIRKMIKKIGIAMLDDPEVGHMLREPLKGKLYRIDPGVKIFRCKFETAPGNQFDVRAQAFKRIEAELKAMGVKFADGVQMVVVERSPLLLDAGPARS